MSTLIKDGTGTGSTLKVNSNNRAATLAVTETIAANHAYKGEAYNVNTGTISLTSDGASGLLYLKNNEDEPLVITAFFYLLGNATNASGDTLVQVLRNPTAGTLISGGTDFVPVNRDFGSNNTLTVTCKKGSEGSTVTGGSVVIESIFTGQGRQVLSVGAIVLRKGNSVAIKMTPASSTSAQDVQMAMGVYRGVELTEEV